MLSRSSRSSHSVRLPIPTRFGSASSASARKYSAWRRRSSSASADSSSRSDAYSRIVSSMVNLGSSSVPSRRERPSSVNDCEPVDDFEVVAADDLRRLDGAPSGEGREPHEQTLLRRLEEVVAPVDCRAERALALWCVSCSSPEQQQSVVEPLEQGRGGQGADAGGGELDRKRQPVERGADVGDGPGVRGRDGEIWSGPPARETRTARPTRIAAGVPRLLSCRASRAARRDRRARRIGEAGRGSSRAASRPLRLRRSPRPPVRRRERARSCRARAGARDPADAGQDPPRGSSSLVARTPRARAAVVRTRSGSWSGARPTNTTPSAKSSRSSAATSMASRVLPVPPVPVNVTSRTSGRRSRSVTSRISRSRPMSDVG